MDDDDASAPAIGRGPPPPDDRYVCAACGGRGHWTNMCPNPPELLQLTEEERAAAGGSKSAMRRMLKRKRWAFVRLKRKQSSARQGQLADINADADADGTDESGDDMDAGSAATSGRELDAAESPAFAPQSPSTYGAKATDWRTATRPVAFMNKIHRRARARELAANGLHVAIDLSYMDGMTEAEQRSLKNQVKIAYADNLRQEAPLKLLLTSVAGAADQLLRTLAGFPDKWELETHAAHYLDVVPREDVVVLTPDSPHVLVTLDRTKCYIVNGLVDRQSQIGLSLGRAAAQKLATARLPLDEHVRLTRSNRLPLNQVTGILAHVAHTGDWRAAILRYIPKALPVHPALKPSAAATGVEYGSASEDC